MQLEKGTLRYAGTFSTFFMHYCRYDGAYTYVRCTNCTDKDWLLSGPYGREMFVGRIPLKIYFSYKEEIPNTGSNKPRVY